ncbi:helix-turn-helix transcriptional regulator [Pantoea dispersa]|uniref:helix-turn-helix transcriptional regulator n=1 Tax=Pantoea dispersa TaxID=59814 RepID=UPI0032153BD2
MDNAQRKVVFTENEVAVTWFFMTGMTMKQIAEWTGLPEQSISYYKKRVMRKVGANNNNEFIIWFLKNRKSYQYTMVEYTILRRRMPINRNR